ncbi:hypothetical protein FRC07_004716, partial [Ceratobasidium sp. 392]
MSQLPAPLPDREHDSHTPSSVDPHVQYHATEHPRFQEVWVIESRYQRSMICALGVSTGGIWAA